VANICEQDLTTPRPPHVAISGQARAGAHNRWPIPRRILQSDAELGHRANLASQLSIMRIFLHIIFDRVVSCLYSGPGEHPWDTLTNPNLRITRASHPIAKQPRVSATCQRAKCELQPCGNTRAERRPSCCDCRSSKCTATGCESRPCRPLCKGNHTSPDPGGSRRASSRR